MTMAAPMVPDTAPEHTSVMPGEIPTRSRRTPAAYLDVAVGGAGHSRALLERCPGVACSPRSRSGCGRHRANSLASVNADRHARLQ
jgi:hypothetical protein